MITEHIPVRIGPKKDKSANRRFLLLLLLTLVVGLVVSSCGLELLLQPGKDRSGEPGPSVAGAGPVLDSGGEDDPWFDYRYWNGRKDLGNGAWQAEDTGHMSLELSKDENP